jgi:YegS/Rv2252/BmrU family lipid kinase
MRTYHIIVNPTAGRGTAENAFPVIEQYFRQANQNFEIQRTTHVGHAIQLAEQAAAAGTDVVVAVGGDGTANEVVNGLMRARQSKPNGPALGVISVGRGNDFAYGVHTLGPGLPATLEAACQGLIDGQPQWIDVGFVKGGDYPDGRFFGNGVGVGFDAVVGFVALKLKRLSGFPSYIVAALKTMFLYFKPPTVRIEFDGESITLPALMVSTMNGRRLGGGFMMAPEGHINDGVFDVCIAGKVSRPAMLGLIVRFMKGTQAQHPAIRMVRADRIKITAVEGSLPAHADGETLCEAGQELELSIVPRALQVIIPVA